MSAVCPLPEAKRTQNDVWRRRLVVNDPMAEQSGVPDVSICPCEARSMMALSLGMHRPITRRCLDEHQISGSVGTHDSGLRPLCNSCDAPDCRLWRLNDANTSRQGRIDHVTACNAIVSTDPRRYCYHLPLRKSSVWIYFSRDTQYVKRIVAVPGDLVRYGVC